MRGSFVIGVGVIVGAIIIGGGIALGVAALDAGSPTPETGAQLRLDPTDHLGGRGVVPLEVDAELGALEAYFVQPDATLLPPPGGLREEVWDLMAQIMTPERAVAAITTYKVGIDPDSERIAWVVAHQQAHDGWILGVNLAKAEDHTALIAALIHEYGHLIEFREGQVVQLADGCTTLILPEGCALPGGYLDAFFRAFWADYGGEAPDAANASVDEARRLYASRPDAFVSEYAALNITEDFAESFAAYVHTDGEIPADAYGGKLAFFDRFGETAQIRNEIRTRLDGTLGTLAPQCTARRC
ncbi:MAG TPA: hypothetical protein VNQ48_02260 [Microbacteriaceae bacterium]|nr:hypothetical protein [Microbacteriaceae bacterium]